MWCDDYLMIMSCINPKKRKKNQWENDRRYQTEFMRKLEAAMRRYKINNIPDTCSERVILQSLIFHGSVVFYKDPEFGDNVFALVGVPSGKGFNINGDPISAYVYSKNGLVNKTVDLYIKGADNTPLMNKGINTKYKTGNPQGVMVWESKTRYPFVNTVEYFARAIADTYRTIDVAKTWLKRPFIPVCEESMKNAVVEAFKAMDDNEEIIPVSTGVKEVTKIDFHDVIGMGDSIKDAVELLDWYEQKYRELCAYHSNTQVDKKGENLISDEIHMNDDFTDVMDEDIIAYLNEQLEFVNECLGTNMSVSVYETEESEVEDEYDRPEQSDDRNDA